MQPLVIVGAGGFARETAAAVLAVNAVGPQWTLGGFLDDDPALWGTERLGVPILGGGVRIGRGAYVGAGALIRETVHIGDYALVGMGSIVLTDVPAGQTWVGAPARYLRDVPVNQRSAQP